MIPPLKIKQIKFNRRAEQSKIINLLNARPALTKTLLDKIHQKKVNKASQTSKQKRTFN
jgi:hypothetical protein